jgi:flavin-dependent dehydrogenase
VTDVVIAGYGPAGAAAAIAAHDAGRSVLILESAERGGPGCRAGRCSTRRPGLRVR